MFGNLESMGEVKFSREVNGMLCMWSFAGFKQLWNTKATLN